jgi:hypothetical protein
MACAGRNIRWRWLRRQDLRRVDPPRRRGALLSFCSRAFFSQLNLVLSIFICDAFIPSCCLRLHPFTVRLCVGDGTGPAGGLP